MRKILLTATALGSLAIPVGLASAQTSDTTDPDTTVTTVVCDQDQSRLRLHSEDCEGCGGGEQYRAGTSANDGRGDTVRLRDRTQIQDRDCDTCTGDEVQIRDQVRLRDQVHDPVLQLDRPLDGAGNQVRAGR
jgi:hypothetical protein